MKIDLAAPSFDQAEVELVLGVLRSGWVTQGLRVEVFERLTAQYVGAPHASAVANCTAALQLALLAAGVRPGDVVMTVSMSFIATANAIRACQAEPVFVDVDRSLNLCPESLCHALRTQFRPHDGKHWFGDVARFDAPGSPLCSIKGPKGRLAAVLVVHQLGMPADMGAILPIAEAWGVPVVEDAACALGSEVQIHGQWERIGKPHGQSACFSYHPRKIITTGDGGMITTADPAVDRLYRLWRQHGMAVSDRARHSSATVVFETYDQTGFNYRLTDLQAALGIGQMQKLSAILERRRSLAYIYNTAFAGAPGVRAPHQPSHARGNWQSYQIALDGGLSRDKVIRDLQLRGISSRRGVMCAHLETPYRDFWSAGCLPRSEESHRNGVVIPLHPNMTDEQAAYVAEQVLDVTRHNVSKAP